MRTNCTAGELAKYLGATIEGDSALVISGVASPESAEPSDLIYLESERHLARALESRAKCALVPQQITLHGKTSLQVRAPKLAFAKAAGWLMPQGPLAEGIHNMALISPQARVGGSAAIGPYTVIESGVDIGEDVQIGAHCYLGKDCILGRGCRLHPHVTLYQGVRLGARVVIHSGTVIGADGFGYVFGEGRHWKFPQVGSVEIEEDVEIGANVTIDRGSLGKTVIGRGTKIDNLVHIAHNVSIGEHTVIAAQTGISGSCSIGANVAMGGQVGLGDHCLIQDGAVLGGQAGVLPGKVIRKGQTVWGTPARTLESFKKQYAQISRLPDLWERLKKLRPGEGSR
jgi:UDP-3-O-[3-hydroxymyristoyl] glucosamine N-acyltransferase